MTSPAVTEGHRFEAVHDPLDNSDGFLDPSTYPLIVDAVVSHSDHNTRLALRQTCRSLQAVVDPHFKKARAVVKFGVRPYADHLENFGMVDVYSDKHRIPALYNWRDKQAASPHFRVDVPDWAMLGFRLRTMADAPAFIFRGSLLNHTTAKFVVTSQFILQQAIAFVRAWIAHDIPYLYIDVTLPPTKFIFLGNIRTAVIASGTWLCSDGWRNAAICTQNVAKIVLVVHFHPSGTCLHMDTPAEWPAPSRFHVSQDSLPPNLVIIFKKYSSMRTPVSGKVIEWCRGELGWLRDMFSGIIASHLQSVIFVDADNIDPSLLGLGGRYLSYQNAHTAVIEDACRIAERWEDGTFPGNTPWTQAGAKAAIRSIKFLTGDQYRQLVGAEQYDLETNCEPEYTLIDPSAYPHIMDAIIKFSDHNTRLAIRQTCKSLCSQADAYIGREHVVVRLYRYNRGWEAPLGESAVEVIHRLWIDRRCHLHPSLYKLGNPHNLTTEEFTFILQTMSRTRVVDIVDDYEISFHMRPHILGPVVDFVRDSIGRDIPTLRLAVKTPLSGTVRGTHRIVIWASEYHDTVSFPFIDTEKVSKVVINIPYLDGGSPVPASDAFTPGRLHIRWNIEDPVPELVVIFNSYMGVQLPHPWLDHCIEQVIRNCHVRFSVVDALHIPRCLIGLDTGHPLSDEDFKRSFINWACGKVEQWSDGHFHPDWTKARAREAIRGMVFYTRDEYIVLVGEGGFLVETCDPGEEQSFSYVY